MGREVVDGRHFTMGRDGNTRPVPFSMGIPVPLTPMIVLVNFDFQEGHLFQNIMESRRMKLLLLLAVYSTENSAAVGAWVCWSRTTQSRPGVYSRMGRAEQQLGGSEEDGQDRQSIAG